MERAVDALKRKGVKINEQLLSHLSPLGWEHINLTGDYIWKSNRILASGKFRRGFAPIFPDICYHLPHYKPAAADIPVASDNPAHYADAIRYNARTPLQGSLLPLTRLVWA